MRQLQHPGLPPSHARLRVRLALSALALLLTSCGGDSTSPTDPPGTPPPALQRSGDAQQGLAGSALADSFEVRVLNEDDDPVVGLAITWSPASGGGSVSPASTVTDAQGRARSQLILGDVPGPNSVLATGGGLQTATFTATGQAPASTVLDPAGNQELGVGPTNYARSVVPEGTIRGVLIYVDFDEAPATETTTEIFERLVPNSIDWFDEVSFGRVVLEITPVDTWYRMPGNPSDYGFATYEDHFVYIQDAANLAVGDVDFAEYDIVYIAAPPTGGALPFSPAFTHVPGGGVTVDGHEIRQAITFGDDIRHDRPDYGSHILIHETGHVFGLPDLYDFDGQDFHRHVGAWDPMGWVGPGTHFMAWHKFKLGWLDEEEMRFLAEGGIEVILSPLSAVGGEAKAVVMRIDASSAYVVEVREPMGRDQNVCGRGVLVSVADARIPTGHGPIRVRSSGSGVADGPGDDCLTLQDAPFHTRGEGNPSYRNEQTGMSVEVLGQVGDGYRVRVRRD